ISTSSSILTDKQKTAFFFVLIPEQMVLLDTGKAAGMFARFNVPMSGYIVNRVIPEDVAAGQGAPAYLKNRYTMQQGYLKQIDQQFGQGVLARNPELERDVTGLGMIGRVAKEMFG
ncbi:MAG TPA: ArsA-related P-loop ATPase, partial [Roseiflexaceae bacterium]